MRQLKWGLLGFALWGCGDAASTAEKAPVQPNFAGKADGASGVLRVGALTATGTQRVALDDTPLAWRFIAFPGTKVRVEARSPDGDIDPVLSVLGPIPAAADQVAAQNDDATPDTFDSAVELTADQFGAFEVVVGSYGIYNQGKATPGTIELEFTCLAGCEQPQMALDELLRGLSMAQVEGALSSVLPALFPDPATAAAVKAQADAFLAGGEGPFPVIPMAALGTAQALFEEPAAEVAPPTPVTFELDALLTKGCNPDRGALTPVHPSLPAELTRGWLPDYRIDDCALQRMEDFANVLNNLALDNGSAVVHGDTRYESVEDVFVALIDSGHHVRVENNRYLANFLGLNWRGASVAAPVWLDTGIAAGDGTVAIPAPHTHHSIYVDGPLVNAKLMYYMGTSGGVSFRADATLRPEWTGERTAYTYDSAEDPDAVIELMVVAGRLRKYWTERGQGLPVAGYGQLGVCNDSTAVLEYSAEGTVTIFPLAQPGIDGAAQSVVEELLAGLPADTKGFDEADALRRIAATMPYADGLIQPVTDALAKAQAR